MTVTSFPFLTALKVLIFPRAVFPDLQVARGFELGQEFLLGQGLGRCEGTAQKSESKARLATT